MQFQVYTERIFSTCLKLILEENPRKGGYMTTVTMITLNRIIFDPHSFFADCQVRTWVVIITTTTRKCSDLNYSIQHDVYINSLITVSLHIDKEYIFPRYGRGKYPGTWVVSIPDVCDNIRKYQSTTVPGTMRRQNWWSKSYFLDPSASGLNNN